MANKNRIDNRWSANMGEVRKQRVATLLIRGLKAHEILMELARSLVNPTTGKPFGRHTIQRDIQEIHAEWRTQTAEQIDSYYGHMLATAIEVQRSAWSKGDLDMVLDASAEIRAIIGKPTKTENKNITVDWSSLSREQLIVMRAGLRAGKPIVMIMASEDWPK